jgi:integrase
MLRHTFVTTMLDAGVDLRDVQIAARHADPRTTMRYDKSRELHQPGEKPQVSRSRRCWNGVSNLRIAAV